MLPIVVNHRRPHGSRFFCCGVMNGELVMGSRYEAFLMGVTTKDDNVPSSLILCGELCWVYNSFLALPSAPGERATRIETV